MHYQVEPVDTASPLPSSDARRAFWLSTTILAGIACAGCVAIGLVMMSGVVRCVAQYRSGGQECIMLFNHYAYQTLPGLFLVVASGVSLVVFIVSLVRYLGIRHKNKPSRRT